MNVLVGPTEKAFRIPQDFLIQYSQALGRMCRSNFLETHTRTIRLPEIEVSMFEDFLVWLHTYEPSLDETMSIDALVDLAIFGEIYLIHHLKNQTSDALRARLVKDTWQPTPDIISKVYQSVPSGSILRQLCSHGFAMVTNEQQWGRSISTRIYEECSEWKTVFEELTDFGWDYFQTIQKASLDESNISWGGACRFHDHSDIFGWKQEAHEECPFSHGPQPLIFGQNMDVQPFAENKL